MHKNYIYKTFLKFSEIKKFVKFKGFVKVKKYHIRPHPGPSFKLPVIDHGVDADSYRVSGQDLRVHKNAECLPESKQMSSLASFSHLLGRDIKGDGAQVHLVVRVHAGDHEEDARALKTWR